MTKKNRLTSAGPTIRKISRTCTAISTVDESKFLLLSDVHYDSVKCDRPRLTRHLKQAEESNCIVLIFGDWFDLMGGKYDPRSTYSDIRPEYKSITYLDDVIEDSYEYLKQFSCVQFISRGNHETGIEKRLHTSPLDRLAQMLRQSESEVCVGGYSGWLKIQQHPSYKSNKVAVSMIHYHHGYGGNARRSKGVLEVDLDQMQFPDADLILRGHTHQKWHVPITVDRISKKTMRLHQQTTHHLRTGSYKMLGDRFAGWATEKGFFTPRLGGWWAEMKTDKNYEAKWSILEAN
jgi:predicted phosphodiesterase